MNLLVKNLIALSVVLTALLLLFTAASRELRSTSAAHLAAEFAQARADSAHDALQVRLQELLGVRDSELRASIARETRVARDLQEAIYRAALEAERNEARVSEAGRTTDATLDSLERAVPVLLRPLVLDLRSQVLQERTAQSELLGAVRTENAALGALLVTRDTTIRLLYQRLEVRDSAITELELGLRAALDAAAQWRTAANPGFLADLRLHLPGYLVAAGVGALSCAALC